MKKIIVGSRDSKLAVIQSQLVMDQIKDSHPELELEMLTMKTTGDIILDRNLDQIGGKGLFVKELDKALRDKIIDFSVHSLKDIPMETPEDLPLYAFPKREMPTDVLVLPKDVSELDKSKPIGSSSPRRTLQLKTLFPDMEQKSIRGNVLTRLEKLDRGEYSALVLAHAGLRRLGLEDRVSRVFTPDEMIPAAGQGILAIQGRSDEDYSYLSCLDDKESRIAATAERAFVTYLDGGCSSPIGAFAKIDGDKLEITGIYANPETGKVASGNIIGSIKENTTIAIELAKELKGKTQ